MKSEYGVQPIGCTIKCTGNLKHFNLVSSNDYCTVSTQFYRPKPMRCSIRFIIIWYDLSVVVSTIGTK